MRPPFVIATTPRVGQNALLGSLRGAFPGANEYGRATWSDDGIMIYASGRPLNWPGDGDPVPSSRWVRLRREDRDAQAVSWAIAASTGRFLSTEPEATIRPEFSPQLVEHYRREIELGEQAWDRHLDGFDVLELVYERDIVTDIVDAARRVLRWWGLPGEPGPTDQERFDSDLKNEWLDHLDRTE